MASEVQALIAQLLREAHQLEPLDLLPMLRRRLGPLGFAEVSVYVADQQQRFLIPLPPDDGSRVLGIDSTLAGRVYQRESTAQESGELMRTWFPVMDGIDRLGVMGLSQPAWNDDSVASCESLAALVAGLLVSKGTFTDDFELAHRLRPMTPGAEICRSLLPPLSFSTGTISVAGALEPAYEVAGDAFDYALNGRALHTAIFDGMGHDFQAARLTQLMVTGYRHCRRRQLSLRAIYEHLDELLRDTFGDQRFVTALLAVLDADDGTLELLNAGHPGPILVRDGHAIDLPVADFAPPLGLGDLRPGPIVTRTVSLEPGDRLLLYTDGITESRADDGSVFGEDRFVDIVERARSETHVLSEAVRRLMRAVGAFHADRWRDDATMVMVHWTPPADHEKTDRGRP